MADESANSQNEFGTSEKELKKSDSIFLTFEEEGEVLKRISVGRTQWDKRKSNQQLLDIKIKKWKNRMGMVLYWDNSASKTIRVETSKKTNKSLEQEKPYFEGEKEYI